MQVWKDVVQPSGNEAREETGRANANWICPSSLSQRPSLEPSFAFENFFGATVIASWDRLCTPFLDPSANPQ